MNVSVLGSTGSVGRQALEVIRRLPGARVCALAVDKNTALLEEQIAEFKPDIAAIADENAADGFIKKYNGNTRILAGRRGVIAAAGYEGAETVLNAVVGSVGLLPTLTAIRAKKKVALANKETLVAAGGLVTGEARAYGAELVPVDSEHSAIFQCLAGNAGNKISMIYLTASGGPFRGMKKNQLKDVTAADALRHPTWNMGRKITVDSATMMNKGLEKIEAAWLFGVTPDRIKIIVHPQSVIHSMVEFEDGAVMAQLGAPDMRVPIGYALTGPKRAANSFSKLDLLANNKLTFEEPDYETFECLTLAERAIKTGGTMPAVMNAANESAVGLFLCGTISFLEIPRLIKQMMDAHEAKEIERAEDVIDAEARVKGEIACLYS